MKNKSVVRCRQIVKTYNENYTALRGIDLQINAGELVAVMGPSGCGKSTLLNILGLLDRPSSGTYDLDEEDISLFKDRERTLRRREKIGFVFQAFNLLPRLSAMENVMLPMGYRGISRKEAAAKAASLLSSVGLKNKEKNSPIQLSGGEKQRVGIARALANDPSLILADEPTGNLDTNTGREILDLFLELNAQNKTIVLVTHDPNIAEKTKRVIHLKDGQIINGSDHRAS
ncbi:MAG: ABC transporter ATP-binding protein [Elusimicrobia bacterium]|nr:ABC transporter ATP-binding protein [Elusimicrobiota bacterium]